MLLKSISAVFKQSPWASAWLILMVIFVVGADGIATQHPLLVQKSELPVMADSPLLLQENYRNTYLQNKNEYRHIVFAPIPYSPGVTDVDNIGLHSPLEKNYYVNAQGLPEELPLRFQHFLGTDARGCDVLSGIIHGARYSLTIAFFAMLITSFIALVTGMLSGYLAAEGWRLHRCYFWMLMAGLFSSWFYGYYIQRYALEMAMQKGFFTGLIRMFLSLMICVAILFLFHKVSLFLIQRFRWTKKIRVPVDGMITRVTELFTAVPKVIFVISLVAFSRPSMVTLIIVFGMMEWTDLSRMIRAEVMRLRHIGYVEASIATGLSTRKIIFRHILPNILPVLIPVFLYGISTIILTESGLAFLGLGVAPGTVTWGNLIAQGKDNIQAWWLMVFPGLMILLTVISLNAKTKKSN